jgi:hypothetical protein
MVVLIFDPKMLYFALDTEKLGDPEVKGKKTRQKDL